jgi:hypothetical protein
MLSQRQFIGDDGAQDVAPRVPELSRFRRSYLEATEPKWQKAVVSQLVTLMGLQAGWDSYGALKPNRESAMFALEVLEKLMHVDTPIPSIVPSHSGGIQLEWHVNQVDLEIHVAGAYKGDLWWKDRDGHEVFGNLGADLSPLRAPIAALSAKG